MRAGGQRHRVIVLAVLIAIGLAAGSGARAQSSPASPASPNPDASDKEGKAARIARASPEIGLAPKGSVALAQPLALQQVQVRSAGARQPTAASPRLPTRFKLPLRIEGLRGGSPQNKFKVTDGDATIQTTDSGEATVDLPEEGRTVVSSDEAPKTALESNIQEKSKTALPWLVLDTRNTTEGPEVLATRPFLQLARAILWDEERKVHVAELLFGVDPEPGNPTDTALSPPFRARFSVGCDSVEPAEAEIERVGPSGYDIVRVACSPAVKNEQPTQYITIHVGTGSLRYPFVLPRRPGPPLLIASSSSFPGLGVGSTTLTVKRIEEDGSPIAADQALTIQLVAAGGGTFTPNTLVIPAGQREASVEVRPAGLGAMELTAVLGELRSAPVRLQLRWPWFAMVAMLAGAVVGAFLSYVRHRRKWSLRRHVADVLSGMLVAAAGLIVPAIAALPGWARPTELGFFLIASVAAFLGLDAFEALARRVMPSVASKDASPVAK
jgi:hypothetical protein